MEREIRVLALITTPLDFNGQTLFPLRMAERMPRVRTDFLAWRVDEPRIRERVLAAGGGLFLAPNRLRRPLAYAAFVARTVRRGRYDVVHCHGNSRTLALDLIAARLGGARVRVSHSHNSQGRYPALHGLLTPLFRASYTHAMACGEEAGGWMFGNRPFEVVPNAVDTDAFRFRMEDRTRMRAALGLAGDARAVGCAAVLESPKNHAFLLSAFRKAAGDDIKLRLLLIGDGSLRGTIAEQIRAAGLEGRVEMLGRREDMPALYSALDALALPSLHEGLPTVALEAQCAGLDTLLSDAVTRACAPSGAARFLPLDEDAWAEALRGAGTRPDREAQSEKNISALKDAGFDLDAAARAMEARYRRFCEATGGRSR